MRRTLTVIILQLLFFNLFSQDFGGYKVGIGDFIRRMYNSQPFNGIKLLQTQEGKSYMISLVELKIDTLKSESIQSRIASIKAKSYASQYINGSNLSSEILVVTTEEKLKDSLLTTTRLQEIFKETSIGFIDNMDLLIKFISNDGMRSIYVYYKEMK